MTNINNYDTVNAQERQVRQMELTREVVERTLEIISNGFTGIGTTIRGPKIAIIVAIRESFGFGLKEAKNYMDVHWDDINFIRKDLEERAGLAQEVKKRVFETPIFRLEIKSEDVSFEQLNEFFSSVLSGIKFS